MELIKGKISIGDVDRKIIFIIIAGIGKFIGGFITSEFGDKINKHPLILGINASMGMFLSLFPFIVIKIISRKRNKSEIKSFQKEQKLIYTNVSKKYYKSIRCQKYLLILSSCLLDYGQKILTFLYIEDIENNLWIFDILFVNFFSFFILKTKLYPFQYFSLSIIIFLGLILNIINLYNISGKIFSLLIILSIEIIFSFEIVIDKYLMEYNFCSPYEISFYEGLFALILNILLLNYTNKDNFSEYYESLDKRELIVFILLMISRLMFNLFGLITVKLYTPSHIALVLIIGEIAFSFMNEFNWKLITTLIIFIILLFMLLVFTEIIELNFWGLQNDTKRNILERVRTQEMGESFGKTSTFSEVDEDDFDDRISKISTNIINELGESININ